MAGELVPLVMIPRYTSYVGAGEYSTAPMEVSAYSTVYLGVWVGFLRGSDATPTAATLSIILEGSQDADTWTDFNIAPAIASGYSVIEMGLYRKWFRMKATLTGNSAINDCAVTCWAVGSFERREI